MKKIHEFIALVEAHTYPNTEFLAERYRDAIAMLCAALHGLHGPGAEAEE